MTKLAESKTAPNQTRLPRLDACRGIAILAMVVFHSVWDLGYFGLISPDVPDHPVFRAYGHAIAASFLAIAGISMVLADRMQQNASMGSQKLFRRFAILGGAAALITVATYFAMPDAFIFFGILHCIFVASLLALLVLRKPLWVCLILAILGLCLPLLRDVISVEAPSLIWLGLSHSLPTTSDWRPLFPWSGFLFLGVAIGKLMQQRQALLTFLSPRPTGALAAWVERAGRHSLAIYMLHQPLLLAIVFGLAQLTGVHVETDQESFIRACEIKCGNGSEKAFCTKVCTCIVDVTQKQPLWKDVLANRLTPEQSQAFNGIAAQCVRQLQPPLPPVP